MDDAASAFLTRLKMRHLRLLVALSETRSLRQASAALSISQPSCSVLLAELEALSGAPLCVRHARGLQLNGLGEIAAQSARAMLHEARRLQNELAEYTRGVVGTVYLGAIVASIADVVAQAMQSMMGTHPQIITHLVTGTSDYLLQQMQKGELDIVIGRQIESVTDPGLICVAPRREPLSVIARKGHPLARKSTISLQELAELQWVLQKAPSPMRRAIDAVFLANGVSIPRCKIETASTYATFKIVESSDICAIVPRSVAESFEQWAAITKLSFELPDFLGPYHVMTVKNRDLSPAATLVRDGLISG